MPLLNTEMGWGDSSDQLSIASMPGANFLDGYVRFYFRFYRDLVMGAALPELKSFRAKVSSWFLVLGLGLQQKCIRSVLTG